MKRLIILEMILMSFIWSPIVMANIYTWADENNIRHFTNQSPPPGAEIFLRDSNPEPGPSPETPDEIEKNDLTTARILKTVSTTPKRNCQKHWKRLILLKKEFVMKMIVFYGRLNPRKM